MRPPAARAGVPSYIRAMVATRRRTGPPWAHARHARHPRGVVHGLPWPTLCLGVRAVEDPGPSYSMTYHTAGERRTGAGRRAGTPILPLCWAPAAAVWQPHPSKLRVYVYDLPEHVAYRKAWHDEP